MDCRQGNYGLGVARSCTSLLGKYKWPMSLSHQTFLLLLPLGECKVSIMSCEAATGHQDCDRKEMQEVVHGGSDAEIHEAVREGIAQEGPGD